MNTTTNEITAFAPFNIGVKCNFSFKTWVSYPGNHEDLLQRTKDFLNPTGGDIQFHYSFEAYDSFERKTHTSVREINFDAALESAKIRGIFKLAEESSILTVVLSAAHYTLPND